MVPFFSFSSIHFLMSRGGLGNPEQAARHERDPPWKAFFFESWVFPWGEVSFNFAANTGPNYCRKHTHKLVWEYTNIHKIFFFFSWLWTTFIRSLVRRLRRPFVMQKKSDHEPLILCESGLYSIRYFFSFLANPPGTNPKSTLPHRKFLEKKNPAKPHCFSTEQSIADHQKHSRERSHGRLERW